MANRQVPGGQADKTFAGNPRGPYRTARLPDRFEERSQVKRVRIQDPVFFEDEPSASSNLAPDPVHLEPPQAPFGPGF